MVSLCEEEELREKRFEVQGAGLDRGSTLQGLRFRVQRVRLRVYGLKIQGEG